jgi:hypothetical protein
MLVKIKGQKAGDVNEFYLHLKDKAEIEDNRKQFNY